MVCDAKAVALIGAVLVTGAGWLGIVRSPVALALPPPPANFTCPVNGGTQFIADPEDPNAFYRCDNGAQTNHEQCPVDTKLMLSTRPQCLMPDSADDVR